MMTKRFILILILLLAFVGCKQATVDHDGDYDKAQKHFAAGEFVLAHDYMLKSAERGNSEAQYNLAWLYLNGVGVEQDVDIAFDWYLSSANKSNSKEIGRAHV